MTEYTIKYLLQAWASIRIITAHGDVVGLYQRLQVGEKSVAPIYE